MMYAAKILVATGVAALFAAAALADRSKNPIVEGLSEKALQLKGSMVAEIDAIERLATVCDSLDGTLLSDASGKKALLGTRLDADAGNPQCFFSFHQDHSETLKPDDIDPGGLINSLPPESYIKNQFLRHVSLTRFCADFNDEVVPFLRNQDITDAVSAVMLGAQCVISVNNAEPLVIPPAFLTDGGVIEERTYDWVTSKVLQSLPPASQIKLLPQPPVTAEPPPPAGP